MKQTMIKIFSFVFALSLMAPATLLGQKDEKEKAAKEKRDGEQIIISRTGDQKEKIIVEINGDKITVNGKPVDEYKDGDVNVRVQKLKEARIPRTGIWNMNGDGENNFHFFSEDANHAMLGVTTEKVDQGVEVQDVTKESAAEKAGLKEKDIITKIDDKKIEDPDGLSSAIKNHKPGDKVTVTYLRDKKEQKATAELTKWKGMNVFSSTPEFKMDMGDMNLGRTIPRIKTTPYGQNWSWSGGGPKLGLSVQDNEDGKGVKVIEVDDESNAEKAGLKEDDIITEVDGKAVNGADEMAKMVKENKDKASMMMKIQRGGKSQNIEVKMPKKIKTADL